MEGEHIISIELLGTFSVSVDGDDVTAALLKNRRAAELVKLLSLANRHRIPREQVIEALWPGSDTPRGAANLRKAAHLARRALGFHEAVALDGEAAHLAPGSHIDTDVGRFEALAGRAEADGETSTAREAVKLYRGELLPDDRYSDWCQEERRHLLARYASVLETAQLWGRLVEVDPLHERAHQEIMAAELASGDRAAALRQFEHLRAILRDHLGVLPNPTSMHLYEEALALDSPDTPTAAERARTLLAWGVVHWERHDADEAGRTAETARALAIDAGLGRELAEASELLGLIAYAQGRWREVFSEQILESMRLRPAMTSFLFDAHLCMTEFALFEKDGVWQVGEVADSILESEELTSQGEALGLLLRGEARLLATRLPAEDAEKDLVASERLHREAGSGTGLAVALERLAQFDSVTDRRELSHRRHREALQLAFESPVRRHLVPFVYGGMLADLDGEKALDLVREAESNTRELVLCPPCSMGYRVGVVRAAAANADWERAQDNLGAAKTVVKMWSAGPWHAAVAEAEATLAAARGADPSRVSELLHKAIAGYRASSRPRDAARCRLALSARNARGTPGL